MNDTDKSSDEEEKDRPDGSPAEGAAGNEAAFHRRGFFTEGFRRLLHPLADIVEDRLERVGVPFQEDSYPDGQLDAGEHQPLSVPADRPVLRPPGALPEDEFLSTCQTSGRCVSVCPVSAIRWSSSGDPVADGKPVIDPQLQACVICDDLACMQACPSGALVPVAKEEIAMGLAELREDTCLRTQGEDCQICVDKCPIGTAAIDIPYYGGAVEVRAEGCTGCGVCEMYCPTEPRAIVIVPPRPGGGAAGGAGGPDDPAGPDPYLPMD